MKKRFLSFIETQQLFTLDDELLVAVSGGVDSMVLCELLNSCDYKFSVAHCNFQLRDADSDADETFVKNYCESGLIPCFTKKFDTLAIAEATKKSIQETARDLRYAWFSELLDENEKLKYILTAHHASDNVETILYRLAKGTGLKGLTGISVKDERRIVRPLLFAFKKDILDYAEKNDIAYREDVSNESDKYRRNYIRHHIVPAFENINPAFEKTVAHSIEIFNAVFSFYTDAVSGFEKKFVKNKKEQTIIDWEKLNLVVHKKILLYEFLSPFNFNPEQVEQIISTLEKENESGKKFSSDTHELLLNRKKIFLREKKISEKKFENFFQKKIFEKKFEKLKFEMSFFFDYNKFYFVGKKFEIKNLQELNSFFLEDKIVAFIDADVTKFPLTIRTSKEGDKFQPFGMDGHSKLLSDYFRDLKLSEFEKEKQLILTDADDEIIWIICQRTDERFKVTEKTTTVWKLSMKSMKKNSENL